jgi:hypothetical protein
VGAFSHCAATRNAVVSTERPLIPLSAIILSSQRQMTDTTYGVQCMLHVEDTLSSVTVSSVVSKVEAIDDAIFEVGSCKLSTNFWLRIKCWGPCYSLVRLASRIIYDIRYTVYYIIWCIRIMPRKRCIVRINA